MKRLSIAELKAQKGAMANTEIYTGGEDAGCHIKLKNNPPRDGTYIQGPR